MKKEITVLNKTGLHARPASAFVQEASKYKCDIIVEKNEKQVNAKSIIGILSLGISYGNTISIKTSGESEKEALDALINLVASGFGEA